YEAIKDSVTLYGKGGVNINTSSREMLEYLDIDKGLVENIMNFRSGEDREIGTSDDGIFESTSSIIDILRESGYLTTRQQQTLLSLISKNLFCVKSDNYRLNASVYVRGKLAARCSAVFGKAKEGYRLMSWSRD
ncbi:MAG: hypothetical protein ABH875_01650, partial [Candidatus Omnitrophota bacterium]